MSAEQEGSRGAKELSFFSRQLLHQVNQNGTEMVATMRDGFGRMEHQASEQTRMLGRLFVTIISALFALLAFVIAGLMLLRGIDPEQAGRAAKVVAEAITPASTPAAADENSSP